MNSEIKNEEEILHVLNKIENEWDHTAVQVYGVERAQEAQKKMFQHIEELLKIDINQLQKEIIVKKLIEESKQELMKIITENEEFNEQEKEVHQSLKKLQDALQAYKQNRFSWGQINIQENIRLPCSNIEYAIRKEININKSIQKIAERLRDILKHIEKEK